MGLPMFRLFTYEGGRRGGMFFLPQTVYYLAKPVRTWGGRGAPSLSATFPPKLHAVVVTTCYKSESAWEKGA